MCDPGKSGEPEEKKKRIAASVTACLVVLGNSYLSLSEPGLGTESISLAV